MNNTLKTRLRDFKLSGIYNSIEERLSFAKEKDLSYTQFLELLLEDEATTRRTNSYKKRYTKLNFQLIKKLKILIFLFSLQLTSE
ncbi:unnamed protein product [marine sediment metagenome]|uniref:IstB-like ATP-binding domain-containing protein n=1 Tax=marine sediment metagenome TaxID=412755 RepID=X0W906_9ZZZZ